MDETKAMRIRWLTSTLIGLARKVRGDAYWIRYKLLGEPMPVSAEQGEEERGHFNHWIQNLEFVESILKDASECMDEVNIELVKYRDLFKKERGW